MRFTVEVFGTIDQVTNFLTEFYAIGDLHRIYQLTISPPAAGSRLLKTNMTIEAMSLQGCQRKQIGDIASERVKRPELDLLRQAVVDRSFFFPANESPRLEEIVPQQIARDATLSVVAVARDPDPWDTLEFAIQGEKPEGLEINKRSPTEAEIRWKPTANGDYEIELAVSDSGSPKRVDARKFKVTVVDPPPPTVAVSEPGFDDASQTFLVGTMASGGEWRAWFNVRTKGDMLKPKVGDELKVGTITGTVDAISDNRVELTLGDARTRLRVGQSVKEGKAMPRPEQPAAAEPATAAAATTSS